MRKLMKSVLLLIVALLAWDASMARSWKAGEVVAGADLKAGDVILMKNRNTSDAWCTWYGSYVGEYSKGRQNGFTNATCELGLFSAIKDRSALLLVEGPTVGEAPSFYLQDVATGRYMKGVEDDTQATLWVATTAEATNYQFDDEAPFAWKHVSGDAAWYFRPFHAYGYTYYGQGGSDMAGWELYYAVEEETSVTRGIQVAYSELKDGMRIMLQVPYQYNSPLAIGNQYMDNIESASASQLHVSNGYGPSNVFVLEADEEVDGAFYVKNESTGKYISCDGSATWPMVDSKEDAISFLFGEQSLITYNYWNRPGGNVRNDLTCSMITSDGANKFGSAHNYNRIVCDWNDVGLWNIYLAEDAKSVRGELADLMNKIGGETFEAGEEKGQYDPSAVAAFEDAKATAKSLLGVSEDQPTEDEYTAAIKALEGAYAAVTMAQNSGNMSLWKEGEQIPYDQLKVGDVILLKNANYQAVNNYGIWLSGSMSTIRNAWQTANQNLGMLPEIMDGSAYELVAAPEQHEGVPSYYLKNVITNKYVYCFNIEGGAQQNTVLTANIDEATPFEIMSAREYSGRQNYDEDAASLVTFVKSEDAEGNVTETACCFSPFHFHGFTYYGSATDMCGWKFFRANQAGKQIIRGAKLTSNLLVAGKRILINNGASYYTECGFYQWLNSSPTVKTLNDGTGAPGSAGSMGYKPAELGSLSFMAGINEGSVFVIETAPEGATGGDYVLKSEKTGKYITADAETRAVTLTENIADALQVTFEELSVEFGEWNNYKNPWDGTHYTSGGKWNVDDKSMTIYTLNADGEKWYIGPAWSYGWLFYRGSDNVPLNIYAAEDPTTARGQLAELVVSIGEPVYNPGDDEGQYDPAAVDAFNNAMSTANALLNGETPAEPTDAEYTAAYDALKAAYEAMPDAYHNFSPLAAGGTYYLVRYDGDVTGEYQLNELGLTSKPRDYNPNLLNWNKINEYDPRDMWELGGNDEDGWTWKNVATGQYISGTLSSYNYNFGMLSDEPSTLALEQVDKFVISISTNAGFLAPDGTNYDVAEPRWPERYGLPDQTGLPVVPAAKAVYWRMVPVTADILEQTTDDVCAIAEFANKLMVQEEGINPGDLPTELYAENKSNFDLLNQLLAQGMSQADVDQILPQLDEVDEELAGYTHIVPDGVYRIYSADFTTKFLGGIDEASWNVKGRGVRWDTYAEGNKNFQFSIKRTGEVEVAIGDDGMGLPIDRTKKGDPWSKKFNAPAPIMATVPSYSIRNMQTNTYAGAIANNQITVGTEAKAGPQIIMYTGFGGRYMFSSQNGWPKAIYKNQGVDLMTGAARDKSNTLAYEDEYPGAMLPYVGMWKMELLGYEVEIGDLGMTTTNLPQAVTVPEGVTAYIVKEESDTKAVASPLEGALPANAAVILRGAKGTYFFPLAGEDAEQADVEGNLLIGTGETGTEVEAGTALVLDEAGTETKFTKNAENVTLPARKAYLANPDGAADAKDIVYEIINGGIYYIERAGGDVFEGYALNQLGLTAYPNQYHKMLNWGVIERNDPRYMWRVSVSATNDGYVIENLATGEFIGERKNYFYTFIDLSDLREVWNINQQSGSTVTITQGDTQLAADDPAYDPTTNRWAARFGFNGTTGGVKDISVVERKGAYTLQGTGDNSKWNLVPVPENLVEYWSEEGRLNVAKAVTESLFQQEGNNPGQIDPAEWSEFKADVVALDERVKNAKVTAADVAEFAKLKDFYAAMAESTQLIKGVYRIKHPDGRATIFGGIQWASWTDTEDGMNWDEFKANDESFLFNIEKTGEEYVKADDEVIVDDDQTADPWSKPFAAPVATAETTKGTNTYFYNVQNRATQQYVGNVDGDGFAVNGADPTDVIFKYTGIGGRYYIAPKATPNKVFYKFAGANGGMTLNAANGVKVDDGFASAYNSMWFVELVGFEVEITDLGLGTTCLPKTVTVPEGMKAYIITKEDAGSGTATLIEGAIPANTPVILQAEAGKYIMPIAAVDVEVPDVSANLLKGTGEEGLAVTAGSVWVVADRDGEPVLRKTADITLPARKAYLPYVEFGSDSPSKKLIFDVTGVKGVKANAQSGKAYDLQGRRVSDNTKGIVIVNGKKVRK